ncbi:gastrula zinc finger protein XlCGF8.2DB-like [Malaya genurostris]|uniref:gastrula zinc finger protein XlCGF8.2DB-like n=1 Tax=Malaya genurostris TaxID=325434 RepID=UPI0026F408D7|nr:gastrula zinc finger protein XlCGF8.2DB-like [Malaya genurostris]XP_058458525.1 gastrula zinc finger protein XlCGF8.2DB-like [Malaya genurostris]
MQTQNSASVNNVNLEENLQEVKIINFGETIQHEEVVQTHENLSTVYKCDSCGITFYSITEHINQYHREEDIMIELEEIDDNKINFGFTEISNDEESSGELPCFMCKICHTGLKSVRSLKLHMKMHDKNNMLGFQIKMKNHCHICNRSFNSEEHLQMHMLGHGEGSRVLLINKSGKGYPCNYCGRRFKRPHEKVKHERIHTGERPYCCDICGKRFRISNCLTIHLRTHEDTRPFVCPYCKKRFKVQSAYNHHLKTHSSERNYRCTFCSKTFKTSVQLHGHKKTHTKPFSCSECNRPFSSLYMVRKHMEEHQRANKLSYCCEICGANYARAFALRDHRKEQHGAEDASFRNHDITNPPAETIDGCAESSKNVMTI